MTVFTELEPTVWSAAARRLAECEPTLQAQIDSARTLVTEQVSRMTKDQIVEHAAKAGVTLKHAAKDDMIRADVDAWLKHDGGWQELQRLKIQANCDRYLARRLDAAVEEADELNAKLRDALTQAPTPGHITYALAWQTDKLMLAACLAKLAREVIRAVEDGAEIRDATMKVGERAMRTVMDFPSRVYSQGTGTAHRIEDTAEAHAASQFMSRMVAQVMDDTVPSAWLAR